MSLGSTLLLIKAEAMKQAIPVVVYLMGSMGNDPGMFFLLSKETIWVRAQFLADWRVCSMLLLLNKIILGRDLWQAPSRTKTVVEPLFLCDHRRMCLKNLDVYGKTPKIVLIYQLNMNNWLTITEECKKTFITLKIISKQQTQDRTLGGTKQEVQTYTTTGVVL